MCVQFKPLDEFWFKRRSEPARQAWCKSCRRAWRWGYREIERVADRQRQRSRAQRT
jgi:hypothetical protein